MPVANAMEESGCSRALNRVAPAVGTGNFHRVDERPGCRRRSAASELDNFGRHRIRTNSERRRRSPLSTSVSAAENFECLWPPPAADVYGVAALTSLAVTKTEKMREKAAAVFRWWHSSKTHIWLIMLMLQLTPTNGGRCSFPDEWKGQYFQSGLGNVIIRRSLVTTKGSCVDQHRDYFLFANREKSCFQCLLMMPRHHNVIQYKESYCLAPDSLKNICAQIRVETPLFTLVRDPALPSSCPFNDAYYFNYIDGQHGFCDQPLSYAKPCVGSNKYQFHFKHCLSTASLHGKDFDVECLATWRDGSELYMYGRVTSAGVTNKDDQYRCFIYQHFGTEVHMSMSADATCRGLRNARDGQFVLELTKDAFGWPSPACRFPDWLKNVTWRDLEGRQLFTLSDKTMDVLSEYYVKKFSSSTSTLSATSAVATRQTLHSEMKCIDTLQRLDRDVTIRSFAVVGCVSKYQCLRIKNRSNSVVELYKGTVADADARCTFSDQYQTLTSTKMAATVCPVPGEYQSTTSRDGCVSRMRVGCRNSSAIDVTFGCQGRATELSVECLTTWQSDDKWYVLVRDAGSDNSRLTNCFTATAAASVKSSLSSDVRVYVRMLSLQSLMLNGQRTVTMEIDRSCNRDVPAISAGLVGVSFIKLGNCGANVESLPPAPFSGAAANQNQIQQQSTTTTVATAVSRDFRPDVDDFRSHRNIDYDDDERDEVDNDTAASSAADDDYESVDAVGGDISGSSASVTPASPSAQRRPKPLVVDIYAVPPHGDVVIKQEALPPYKSNSGSGVGTQFQPNYLSSSSNGGKARTGGGDVIDDDDDDYDDSGLESAYRGSSNRDVARTGFTSRAPVWPLHGQQKHQMHQVQTLKDSPAGLGAKSKEPVLPRVRLDGGRSGSPSSVHASSFFVLPVAIVSGLHRALSRGVLVLGQELV